MSARRLAQRRLGLRRGRGHAPLRRVDWEGHHTGSTSRSISTLAVHSGWRVATERGTGLGDEDQDARPCCSTSSSTWAAAWTSGGVVQWSCLPPHRVALEDTVRREIGGIGSLVAVEQSWCVVYRRCAHRVQFPCRDLPHVEDAERLVREYLATCPECARPLPPAPLEDPVRRSVRDFWRDQQIIETSDP